MSLKDVFSSPLSRHDFAARILMEARTRGLDGEHGYDPDQFTITASGDHALRLNLANAYSEYRGASPWRRSGVIAMYAQTLARLSVPEDLNPEAARSHLLPRIRERVLFENFKLEAQIEEKPGPDLLYRVLGEHLTLEVVYDEPTAIRTVNAGDLQAMGLTFEDALALANQNMTAFGTANFKSPRPGLYVSEWRDCYDASRLHLPGVVPHLSVKGRPVAMIPNRDVLLVTGADDEAGLIAMAKMAETALTKPRPMSGFAFRLDGGWTPYLPPAGHAAHDALRHLAVRTMSGYYAAQKQALDTLYRKRGEEIVVASVLIGEDTKQSLTSFAAWAEGRDTMLPVVDTVAFVDAAGTKRHAPWDRVQAMMPEMLEAQGLYPGTRPRPQVSLSRATRIALTARLSETKPPSNP